MSEYTEKIERIIKAIDVKSLEMFDDQCEYKGWHVTKLIIPKNNQVMIETIHPIFDQQEDRERHGFSRYAWIDFSPEATEEEITQGLIANIIEYDQKMRENIGDALISAISQRTPIVTTDATDIRYDHKVSDELMASINYMNELATQLLDMGKINEAMALSHVISRFHAHEIQCVYVKLETRIGLHSFLY